MRIWHFLTAATMQWYASHSCTSAWILSYTPPSLNQLWDTWSICFCAMRTTSHLKLFRPVHLTPLESAIFRNISCKLYHWLDNRAHAYLHLEREFGIPVCSMGFPREWEWTMRISETEVGAATASIGNWQMMQNDHIVADLCTFCKFSAISAQHQVTMLLYSSADCCNATFGHYCCPSMPCMVFYNVLYVYGMFVKRVYCDKTVKTRIMRFSLE